MSARVKNKATNEQTGALIRKYSTNESVLRILYTGKINTLIMLEHGLQKGLTLGTLAGGSICSVSLPECRNGNYLCNDMYSFKVHMEIVRKILQNFINQNPQYFTLKPDSQRYAISDNFVIDVLLSNNDKEFDYRELVDLLPLINNLEIFEQIAKTFYLPFAENGTFEQIKKKYWKKIKPFTVKETQIKKLSRSYIMYGTTEIPSKDLGILLEEMKYYYDTNLKAYHTVAYLNFMPHNLKEAFPLCKLYTFQEIYDIYRGYKPLAGRKEGIGNDINSIIFPKYSIIDCQLMPTLSAYKRIFGKLAVEDAHRFIIFVNYHAKEVFHGSGGEGHILFSSGNEVSENSSNKQGAS
jgi:hypothetical protein